ncbi:hypothetical protein, partial [Kluyvera ascorbata]|uniref:hypothetical protein n=1 Tax=Kluyvera ascorbata TaxID=51288 RepID=UPI0028DFEDC9
HQEKCKKCPGYGVQYTIGRPLRALCASAIYMASAGRERNGAINLNKSPLTIAEARQAKRIKQ